MAPLLTRLIVLAAGLLVTFRGYSTFRAMLGLTGFVIGAHALASHPNLLPASPPWLAPTLVVASGLVAAALVVFAWKFGVPLLGAAALVLVGHAATIALPLDPVTRLVGLALVALAGALLARFLERVLLSIATAFYGAFIVASALAAQPGDRWWLPMAPAGRQLFLEPWFFGLWIALAVGGSIVQLKPREKAGTPRDDAG